VGAAFNYSLAAAIRFSSGTCTASLSIHFNENVLIENQGVAILQSTTETSFPIQKLFYRFTALLSVVPILLAGTIDNLIFLLEESKVFLD
jgi:hypothetical protein